MALAAVAVSLTLTAILDKPIYSLWQPSLVMAAVFACSGALSWKIIGSDKGIWFWLPLSLLTAVFNAIFSVLAVVMAMMFYDSYSDTFFTLGLIYGSLFYIGVFPLPLIMLFTFLYCKFLHKGVAKHGDET